jgi:tetrahedral aminopeptidase
MILKELSEAVGVSGREEAVRKIVLEAIDGHAEDIRIDALGSVTALKKSKRKGKKKALRVMLAAHMDEVGFMVTGFESNGLIRFSSVGSVDDRILPGLRVRLGADLIPGVIIWTPIHKNREQNVTKISNLRIDIGASSKEAASGKLKRGDRIAFDSRFMELGATTLRGKSFDDRVGCSLLVDVLRGGPYAVDVLAAFTVQEEIGLRGARVAAQTLQPDVSITLEGTTAHDVPDPGADPDEDDEVNPACRMGAGPVITVMDRSVICDPRLVAFVRQTAEAHDIPYQVKTMLGGGTDAGAIHLTGAGVPSIVLSMPCRYIHSPSALLNKDDYAHMLRLLQTLLDEMPPGILRHD